MAGGRLSDRARSGRLNGAGKAEETANFWCSEEVIMFFKQLATKEASLSYFFGCAGKGRAVAVDVVAGDEAHRNPKVRAQRG